MTSIAPIDVRSTEALHAAAAGKIVVSVVMPCYNEELFILKALEQLAGQYEPDRFEIIVVDGMSVDQTRDLIRDFQIKHPELSLTVIDNHARNIPTGLNLGISAAAGEFIARMDAHAAPSEGYIRHCIGVLRQENTGVVGMPCHVRPGNDTVMARAIAAAVSHPFGIGDAKYRLGQGTALQESVDTVAFACFRKSLWQELAGFNESLLTNEDYDFNYRVRLTGREVILDRSGHCNYFARTSLGDLAAQYSRYGRWKARMILLHPRSIKLRHLVAPAFVLSIAGLVLISIFQPLFAGLLALEVGIYFFLALVFAWRIAQRNHDGASMMLVLPFVFFVIHLTWGASFLLGLGHKPR